MPRYKVVDEGDSFFTIESVPIFEMHTNRGFPCDTGWMKAAIESHATYKDGGYRPTIIIGHNVRGKEKESVGFLDRLVLKGKRLYADLVRVPKGTMEKIVRNAYPSRSVEVLPKSKRILTLALLGGTTPHFPLPQMAYEQDDNGETHLFFRSPAMNEMTDEMKKEIYGQVSEAVAKTLPEAFTKLFEGDGEDTETATFTDEAGTIYAVPAALAALLAKAKGAGAVATHVGKAGAAGGKVAAAAGIPRGAGRAVGRQVGKAGRFIKRHPVGAAAAVGAGAAAGRATKRRYAIAGYQIDDETGEVYLDGEAVGVVFTYADLQEAGMDVPTAVKKPEALPGIKPIDPQLEISSEDVGEGTGEVTGAQTAVPAIAGDLVQPLDRDESAQFVGIEELEAQNYDLHHRLEQVETANALIVEGRRAEEYKKWLEEQRTAGVPVGDIEKTVDFMMSLSAEQATKHKALLLAQPKVAFAKAEETLSFMKSDEETAAVIKQDYAQNKETYQALGVSDKDLRYAQFVRINRAVGEVQP